MATRAKTPKEPPHLVDVTSSEDAKPRPEAETVCKAVPNSGGVKPWKMGEAPPEGCCSTCRELAEDANRIARPLLAKLARAAVDLGARNRQALEDAALQAHASAIRHAKAGKDELARELAAVAGDIRRLKDEPIPPALEAERDMALELAALEAEEVSQEEGPAGEAAWRIAQAIRKHQGKPLDVVLRERLRRALDVLWAVIPTSGTGLSDAERAAVEAVDLILGVNDGAVDHLSTSDRVVLKSQFLALLVAAHQRSGTDGERQRVEEIAKPLGIHLKGEDGQYQKTLVSLPAFEFPPGDVALGQKGAAQMMLSRAGENPWKRLPRRGDVCLMRELPILQAVEVGMDRARIFHSELVGMAEQMAKDTGLPLKLVLMHAVAFEKEVVDAKGNRFTPGSVPREIHLPLTSKVFVLLPREMLEGWHHCPGCHALTRPVVPAGVVICGRCRTRSTRDGIRLVSREELKPGIRLLPVRDDVLHSGRQPNGRLLVEVASVDMEGRGAGDAARLVRMRAVLDPRREPLPLPLTEVLDLFTPAPAAQEVMRLEGFREDPNPYIVCRMPLWRLTVDRIGHSGHRVPIASLARDPLKPDTLMVVTRPDKMTRPGEGYTIPAWLLAEIQSLVDGGELVPPEPDDSLRGHSLKDFEA